ncbi:hypothetical protein MKQ68_23880 [Chitinophaga horti]|uniref:Beta-lactamase-inhibitor-like, PepSY-like n=1 Tax=Chitinophaga horti TaxID=2920382 RepID=A0ABY6J0H4_9BACT|nr:hypothetical protein [Chitinophaga horti]UYQ93125.1 hypothetical protein MKQ68_23880 [Chitinophaga horti]
MKRVTLIICAALLSSGMAFAQQKKSSKKTTKVVAVKKVEAPENVKTAFQQNFTGSSDVKWTKSSAGNWIANFTQSDVKTSAEYNGEGSWVATRTEFGTNIPEGVSSTLKTKYPAAVVKEGWKIERSDVAAYYKISIDDNGAAKTVLLNEAGTITE